MLEVKFEYVDHKELSLAAKVRLAYNDQEFGVILENDTLKINKRFKQNAALHELLQEYFSFDHLLTCDEAEKQDTLHNRIAELTSRDVAGQLSVAWMHSLDKKLDEEANRAAADWLDNTDVDAIIDSFDSLGKEYPTRILDAIYKKCGNLHPVFIYGYLCGAGNV